VFSEVPTSTSSPIRVASSRKKRATRLSLLAPARKCLPSHSSICMRWGQANRRLSWPAAEWARLVSTPIRRSAR